MNFSQFYKYLIVYLIISFFLNACSNPDAEKEDLFINQKIDSLLEEVYNDRLSNIEKNQILNLLESKVDNVKKSNERTSLLFKIANRHEFLNNFSEYKQSTEKAKSIAYLNNDSLSIAKSYYYLGDYYSRIKEIDSAYRSYTDAQNIFQTLKDEEYAAKMRLKKAYMIYNSGNYSKAENETIISLRIAKRIEDPLLTYECLNFLGVVLTELDNPIEGIKYHNEALEELNNLQNFDHYTKILNAQTLNNKGLSYIKYKDTTSGIKYINDALTTNGLQKVDPIMFAEILSNYAFYGGGTKDEVYNQLITGLLIRDSLNSPLDIIDSKIKIAKYYSKKNDTRKSNQLAQEAYDLAKQINDLNMLSSSLLVLADANPLQSESFLREYISIEDSLKLLERQQQTKFTFIDYETEKVIQEKESSNERNAKLRTQKTIITIILISLILLGLFIFLFFNQRSKNKELFYSKQKEVHSKELLEATQIQQEKLEEGQILEQKRISQELHDGVMGKLSSIRLNLFSLKMNRDDETIEHSLSYIDKIQEVEKEIRNIAHDLNEKTFSVNSSFKSMIANLLKIFKTDTKIDYFLNISDEEIFENLQNSIKIHCYRILQEATQNIRKHSGASEVIISFHLEPTTLIFKIIDNGNGFIVEASENGIGIINMKSRVKEMNGDFRIKSSLEKGTEITLAIPLK